MRRYSIFLAVMVMAVAVFAGCSKKSEPGSPTPTPSATPVASASATPASASTPTASPAATAAPGAATPIPQPGFSDLFVPTAPTTFRVRVPANTPGGDDIYLALLNVDGGIKEHIEMQPDGDGYYSVTADAGVGALVRYTYDRWDGEGCCDAAVAARESLFTGEHTKYRLLVRDEETGSVEDVVAQWDDHEFEFDRANVSGRIVDATTGEPVMDAEVSAGGLHIASKFDGTFTVEGLPAGPNRIVAYTVTGDYQPSQAEIDLSAGDVEGIEISLAPVEMKRVRLTAHLPAGTPDIVDVRIGGNLWQLGGRETYDKQPLVPSSVSSPAMRREGDTVTAEFDLPTGAYVEYTYWLSTWAAGETRDFARLFRSFIVEPGADERIDEITQWANEGWPLLTVRLTVPENTPPGVPVYLTMGPSYPMRQIGPFEYAAAIGSYPPGGEATLRFNLGDDLSGGDGTRGLGENGARAVVFPQESGEIAMEVTKWESLPDPAARGADGSLNVTFRLSVPLDTPELPDIRLFGDRPAIPTGGVQLEQVPGNPWLYQASVSFDHDGPLSYSYRDGQGGATLGSFDISTDHDGQVVSNYISDWAGATPEPREGWISGIYTPDYWSESFLPELPSAFDAAREANGEWVAISSVWSFGQIQPYPTIESRPQRIWSVFTPIEDIRAQAAIAREKGMKVFLAPQMNPEVHPNWQDETVSAGSAEWWDLWLTEAEAQWMWNAIIGEEIGAEMLMLPGYVFHVFPPTGFFEDPEGYAPQFDLAVQGLIGKVREVYSGKILISGGQTDYDFPGLADYVGVTTYDIGVPNDLPADASFNELTGYYEPRFEEKVDALYARWHKPVLFYTIHAPAKAQDGDPFGELFQAAAYEALFRLIYQRPHVTGSFTWSYSMNGGSQFLTDGVRGRTAEAVMAKWHEVLSGR